MTIEQYFKNLQPPVSKSDVVIDTDTYNEVDDQFAVAYLLAAEDKVSVKALYAAPFLNEKSVSPEDGMIKSYDEIIKILKLAGKENLIGNTFKGSSRYLENETEPIISDAAADLAERAACYSPENPLYVISIGAITNVASALLINPSIAENIVIVWLGGHGYDYHDIYEFNMYQDVAAARVVFGSNAPLIQIPCQGVASGFVISYAEMEKFLKGKNKVCDFLVEKVREALGDSAENEPAARVIWDVTAAAWMFNEGDRFMLSKTIHSPIPEYDNHYAFSDSRRFIQSVYLIKRGDLASDLFKRIVSL